jgi:choline monooxygenase
MEALDGVLKSLVDLAKTPFSSVTAMAPVFYRNAELLELERERIFAKAWMCPGFAAEVPNHGDYLTFSINDQPLFTVRGGDGVLRSFSNVCRHRMMRLLEGHGHCRAISCPYHGWSYGLDGRLVGAPGLDKTPDFQLANYTLPSIRTEVWEGWIYVTLDPDVPSIVETLKPLYEIVARYDMPSYVPVATQDQVWLTNWKILTENFMEGYHFPIAHRQTLGPSMPLDSVEFPAKTYDRFIYQTYIKNNASGYGQAHPANTRLDGKWRYTGVLPTIYPTHMFSLAPDYLFYLSLRPKSVGEVHVRIGIALPPEVLDEADDRELVISKSIDMFERLNAEDQFIVEGIYKNLGAPLARPGPLTRLEYGLHDFAGYLARRLVV